MNTQSDPVGFETESAHLMVPLALLDELSATTSRDDVLGVYAKWAKEVVPSDRSAVALSDDGETLCLKAIEGNAAIGKGMSLPVEGTFIGEVVASGQATICHDFDDYPDADDLVRLRKAGLRCSMVAPLVAGNRIFGALAAAFSSRSAINQDDFLILQIFAKCIGSYLLLHEQLEMLSKMVLMDPLTSAYNRRYFDQVMARNWEMWLSRDRVFGVVQFDLDHFKRVNDTHGHYVGDTVLKGVVRVANRTIRPDDVICRMGGEEFALILNVPSIEEAFKVAERLRQNIEKAQFKTADGPITVTVSMGVAVCRNEHPSPKAVTLAADEALYAAKAAGRNRVMPAR